MYVVRRSEESKGYIKVENSTSFVAWGNHQMSVPGPKSKLESRTFLDMKYEQVEARKAEIGKVCTLPGIKSRYQYVCQPNGKVRPPTHVLMSHSLKGSVAPLLLLLCCLHGQVLE